MNNHFKSTKPLLLALIVTLIISGTLSFHSRPSTKKTNIVLITIDALRADHLSAYGYKRDTSPNIDALANNGILFRRAIAQSSHTPPCMGSIASSTFVTTHGIFTWGNPIRSIPTLPKVLKSYQFRTIFITDNPTMNEGLPHLTDGFDIVDQTPISANGITQQAVKSIPNNKPFFMWLHFMDAHNYTPDQRNASRYFNDPNYNATLTLPITQCTKNSYGYNGIPECLTQRLSVRNNNPDHYIALYDAAIHDIDEQIGSLRLQLPHDTLFIITSDHGELLGEHGYYFHHGYFLYQPLLHIPLILSHPDMAPVKYVIPDPVSANIDIAPTILSFLGLPIPNTFKGHNLLDLKTKRPIPSPVFSISAPTYYSSQNDQMKVILNIKEKMFEVFDLRKDPEESDNIPYATHHAAESLIRSLKSFSAEHMFLKLFQMKLNEDTIEKLKSLGYAQ